MFKGVESLKKRIKISTKPLKVLPVRPREEHSSAKPFFKFRKPPPKIKGPGPSIMANHIGSKFGPILLGKKQNLHGAAPPEAPSN